MHSEPQTEAISLIISFYLTQLMLQAGSRIQKQTLISCQLFSINFYDITLNLKLPPNFWAKAAPRSVKEGKAESFRRSVCG